MDLPYYLMYRPPMASSARDPLAEVLGLLQPQAVLTAELRARGPWSLAFDGSPVDVKFGLVLEGECVLAFRGSPAKTLRTGDIFLCGGPPPYVIGSDLTTPSQSAREVLHRTRRRVVRLGRDRQQPVTHLLGGRFVLDAVNAHLLVAALPAFARIPADEATPLRSVMRLLVEEVRSTQLGRARTLDHLTQLVLTYALRWLDSASLRPAPTSWLRALADAQIGAALRHIHTHVAQGTSLAELARVAGMSRTAFAGRFKALVGQPPLTYALTWRMALAKHALRATDRAIGELAFEIGYGSESAFSMAFRREVGCSPRAYRQASAEEQVAMARGERAT